MLEYNTSHSDTGTEINKCLSHMSARDSAKIQLSSNIFLDQNILDKRSYCLSLLQQIR